MSTNLQEENKNTFLDLFEEHSCALSNYCRAICNSREDAEDLMGDTVVIAFKNFHKVREPQKFKYYLFGIASRLFKKQLRRKRIVQFLPVLNAKHIPDSESSDDKAALQVLYRSIHSLKPVLAEIVVLKELSGFTTKEIADMLQMNENTVKTNLSRAKQKLADKLRSDFDKEKTDTASDTELKHSPTSKTILP